MRARVGVTEALPEGEAHLYWVRQEDADDPALREAYLTLLTAEERARHDRFLFEHSQHEFLLTRALVRTTLSRYAEVDARAWRFCANKHGCPAIDEPKASRAIRFNLSNTRGLVTILVARERDVGVDVEDKNRRGETVNIADRFFSESEVAALRQFEGAAQRSRFFDFWTLKEAYIKARGMGLAIPLGHFSFSLPERGPISIAFDPRLDDDATSWQFMQVRPTERHVISLALRRPSGADVALRVARVVPLR